MELANRGSDGNWLAAVDRPPPALGENELRITVEACAMCRTDLQLAAGDIPAHRDCVVLGHQVVGTVSEIGEHVSKQRLGKRVGLVWLAFACGVCRYCTSGRENLCDDAKFTGWDVDGGYGTQVVAQADFAFDLDAFASRPATEIAPLLCAGVIGYRALRVAGVGPGMAGMRLGLYGYGASARQVLRIANSWGIESYVASRTEADCSAALADGAAWAGHYDDGPPYPLDAAITFAPIGSVVVAALKSLAKGAVVAINAIHLEGIPAFNYDDLWWERSIRSVANVTRADAVEFLAAAAAIDLQVPHEVIPLAEANLGLSRIESGDVVGSLVLAP